MKSEIKGIIRIQLNQLVDRLKEQDINLSFTDYALDYLSENGFDPQYGVLSTQKINSKRNY